MVIWYWFHLAAQSSGAAPLRARAQILREPSGAGPYRTEPAWHAPTRVASRGAEVPGRRGVEARGDVVPGSTS